MKNLPPFPVEVQIHNFDEKKFVEHVESQKTEACANTKKFVIDCLVDLYFGGVRQGEGNYVLRPDISVEQRIEILRTIYSLGNK